MQIVPLIEAASVAAESEGWLQRLTTRLKKPSHQSFDARPASVSDLPVVHKMLCEEFGKEAPSWESVQEYHRAHPEHFWVVIRSRHRAGRFDQEIVGTFKVLRANKLAVSLLDIERLSGTSFKAEHFANADELPEAIYIGDVVGKSGLLSRYRGATMIHLLNFLDRQIARGVPFFYSRPLSKEGLSWSVTKAFAAVNPSVDGALNRIYRRDNRSTPTSMDARSDRRPARGLKHQLTAMRAKAS